MNPIDKDKNVDDTEELKTYIINIDGKRYKSLTTATFDKKDTDRHEIPKEE